MLARSSCLVRPPVPRPRRTDSPPRAVAAPVLPVPLEAGGLVGGRYRLERRLAVGGMACVWRGFDATLGRAVALKFLQATDRPRDELERRFLREARALARLRSAHVVQILDYDFGAQPPYLVMELLDGEDLATRLRRVGRLSREQVACLAHELCEGLEAAHAAGIVHRDLKPQNVVLAKTAGIELAKIVDFGVALMDDAVAARATCVGELLGSPGYMSPEQVGGAAFVDRRSDLWSLAATLYRALTGQPAFPGPCNRALVAIRSGPIPVPSQLVPEIPPEVDAFFQRAFARDPERRFQTAMELAASFCGAVLAARTRTAPPRARGESTDSPAVAIEPPPPSVTPCCLEPTEPATAGMRPRRTAAAVGGVVALGLALAATLALDPSPSPARTASSGFVAPALASAARRLPAAPIAPRAAVVTAAGRALVAAPASGRSAQRRPRATTGREGIFELADEPDVEDNPRSPAQGEPARPGDWIPKEL